MIFSANHRALKLFPWTPDICGPGVKNSCLREHCSHGIMLVLEKNWGGETGWKQLCQEVNEGEVMTLWEGVLP